MLEIGELAPDERVAIEARMSGSGRGIEDVLTQATQIAGRPVALRRAGGHRQAGFRPQACGIRRRGAGQGAGRSWSAKTARWKTASSTRPPGLPVSALAEASNYLNARLRGRTLDTARAEILAELESERAELDALTAKIVAEGLATLAARSRGGADEKVLIVRGTSHLLDSVEAQADIERVRTLFDDIERKNDLIRLLELAKEGDGVRIFIGSENRLFCLSGSSIVAAPYANAQARSWA